MSGTLLIQYEIEFEHGEVLILKAGAPVFDSDEKAWVCEIAAEPLFVGHKIRGVDPFQSLALAMQLLNATVKSQVDRLGPFKDQKGLAGRSLYVD